MPRKILIADDHRIVREGLTALLAKEDKYKIIGYAKNGHEAIREAIEKKPDVVIMDLNMPELNGYAAIKKIVSQNDSIKILVLSMLADKMFISRAFKEGAHGYVLKDCAYDELINAIEAVCSGGIYISPDIAGVVIEEFVSQPQDSSIHEDLLSAREREVLQLLAEGKSTKEIAYILDLSPKTIETYRSQIMGKLDIYNIAELTKYAIREGLTDLN
ncbi:MAG: response regulator transcription factor [Thermodesulfovibrionales bacterium]|nr:response regulator transcription factor [Thermodesulfovibrionales bacterium]